MRKWYFRNGDIEVRPAQLTDVEYLAPRLRAKDVEEVEAVVECDIKQALLDSYEMSERCYVVTLKDDPIIIFGIAPLELGSDVGVPWMLGTDRIPEIGFEFARHGKAIANEVFAGYSVLRNVTMLGNGIAHRWLIHLGFQFDQPLEGAGRNGETLIFFSKEQGECATP